MYYVELCIKKIGHKICLGDRSDGNTRSMASVSIDGNGNAIKIVRKSNVNVHTLFTTYFVFKN